MKIIELTQRVIKSPKKFTKILCTFNNYENHLYEDRLERIGLSKGKFKKALYPIMLEIEKSGYDYGRYGFTFPQFNVITTYDRNEAHLRVITLLTKSMKLRPENLKYVKRILKWSK